MVDKNKTRVRQKKIAEKNKTAFIEIIGDPFTNVDGCYILLHSRSYIHAIEGTYGETKENVDPAKPSISDFFCDVDKVIETAIEPFWLKRFVSTYLYGETNTENTVPKEERKHMVQRVGQLLRSRGISPVKRYFTVNPKVKNNGRI